MNQAVKRLEELMFSASAKRVTTLEKEWRSIDDKRN